ncbi:MAG: glycoside hydrolase family 97 catalytic domain-containing protein, partial [Calditrichia bacterium]
KPTGESRTYPNMMTREGVRGTEYEAWSSGNPPEHTTILPFTRMLAGPIDYTPGIFDLTFNQYKPENRVHTTLAKQLAVYVVIFSPVQMAADLIENYENQPAFAFIEDVPVTWQETRVLNAKIGDYVTIVRRNGNNWFMGSITDENARKLEIPLDFLESGMKYVAHCYADGADANWEGNPAAISIHRYIVDAGTVLKAQLARGGGQAVRFSPASERELSEIPAYQSGE